MKDKYGKSWFEKWIVGRKRKRNGDKKREELLRDLKAGQDALDRALSGDWWEWLKGSRLHFWLWPKFFQREARDGSNVCKLDKLPSYWNPQQMPDNKMEKDKLVG